MLYLKFLDTLFLFILLLLLLLANKSYVRFIPVNPWDVYEARNLKHMTIISFAKYTNLMISFSKRKVFPKLVKRTAKQRFLTYSMAQSPSWEANWFAASQEIPRISRNPKVNYRTHKLPPPVSILGQPNPVHIPTSHLLEIHPYIIHPSKPRSPQWSLSLRFPQQDHSSQYSVLKDVITSFFAICSISYPALQKV